MVGGTINRHGGCDLPRKVYRLEKRSKIRRRVREQNARAPIGRFCGCQVGLSEYLTKGRGVEGQGAGVDAEEGVSAQRFDVPILEVECVMGGYNRRVDGGPIIGSICNGEVR